MKSITLISLLALVTACGNGNPHVSSVRDGIDRVVSPITQEECEQQHQQVQVTTDENHYQDLTNCRGDSDQEQQQQQEDGKDSTKWKFLAPGSQFGTHMETASASAISVRDCNGKVIVEKALASGSSFIGVTTPTYEICEVEIAY